MILLILLIVLTLTRTDVGLEVEGSLNGTGPEWVLTTEIPAERLRLLRRCQYVRIRDGKEQEWDGLISRISGQWEPSREGVRAQIEIAERARVRATAPDSSGQRVQAMLIERQNVPVLKVLVETVFMRPGS